MRLRFLEQLSHLNALLFRFRLCGGVGVFGGGKSDIETTYLEKFRELRH
jgi:hypothetical protein